MRHFLLVLALALAIAPSASAQTSFGLTAGLNAANVSIENFTSSDAVDKQPRLGLTAGVFAELPVSASLSVHPELIYSQQGYKVVYSQTNKVGGGILDGTVTVKVDYIELPVMLAYHIRGANGLDVAIEAGPYVAYKLSEGVSCSGDATVTCDNNGGNSDAFKSLDVGAGAGVVVAAGPYGFGLRYANSITAINDTGNTDFRNQVLSVFARYRFGQ